MKKSLFALLFLTLPLIAQQKEQEGRYKIYFQPAGDAGVNVTILLDSQTGKTWQLIRDDSVFVSYDAKSLLEPNRFYVWHPIIFETYPYLMPMLYKTLPPSSRQ